MGSISLDVKALHWGYSKEKEDASQSFMMDCVERFLIGFPDWSVNKITKWFSSWFGFWIVFARFACLHSILSGLLQGGVLVLRCVFLLVLVENKVVFFCQKSHIIICGCPLLNDAFLQLTLYNAHAHGISKQMQTIKMIMIYYWDNRNGNHLKHVL